MSYRTAFQHREEPAVAPFVFQVPVAKCRFTLQAISAPHLFEKVDLPHEDGPLSVSVLSDGNYFVHNGRHRVIRALLDGTRYLDATSLYSGDGTRPHADANAPIPAREHP